MYIDFRYIYRNSLIISKSMGNVTKSFMQYLIGFAVLTAVLGHSRCIPIHSSIDHFFKHIPKNFFDFFKFILLAKKLVVERQLVIDVGGLHIFEGSLVH